LIYFNEIWKKRNEIENNRKPSETKVESTFTEERVLYNKITIDQDPEARMNKENTIVWNFCYFYNWLNKQRLRKSKILSIVLNFWSSQWSLARNTWCSRSSRFRSRPPNIWTRCFSTTNRSTAETLYSPWNNSTSMTTSTRRTMVRYFPRFFLYVFIRANNKREKLERTYNWKF